MTAEQIAPEISVIIPAYNEAENLPVLAAEIEEALEPLGRAWELIIVEDGSTDGTGAIVADLAAVKPFVRPIYFDANYGQTSALDAGIRAARGGAVVLMDADLQNDPADVPRLLAELDNHDAAVGWRAERKDPWTKKLTSRLANAVRRWATGDEIHDVSCTLKAFRARAIKGVKLYNGMHRFLSTLVKMEGGSLVEVKVNHRPRRFGRSKYGIFNRFLKPFVDLLAVMWMRRRALRYRVRNGAGAAETAPAGKDTNGGER